MAAKKEKPQILVSSDVVGVFGDLRQLFKIYYLCLPILKTDQLAIEMLTWQQLISDSQQFKPSAQINIQAMHGSMISPEGSPNLFEFGKTLAISQVMAEIVNAIEDFSIFIAKNTQPHYFLLHEPDLRKSENVQYLQHLPAGTTVLVENVLEKGSLQKTIDRIINLKSAGLQAGIMLDLVHILKEITGEIKTLHKMDQKQFDQVWSQILALVEKTITLLPGSGLHIPIGVNGDSLPLELMQKQHWQELGQVIKKLGKKIQWITIENQQENLLRIKAEEIAPLAVRNQRVLGKLAESGVL